MSALLVAIEGIDGSGKGTQAGLLRAALEQEGRTCALIAFPRYSATTFGRTIARYLNGEFGDLQAAGPHFAALVYAGDRFESRPLIELERQSHQVVIFDRYVPSNLAHQAAKLPAADRDAFLQWVESIEYGVYQLPRPDMVIYLNMPVSHAQNLIRTKPKRSYTSRAADLHEADAEYLARTAEVYQSLASRDPTWRVIACCRDDTLRSVEAVHQDVAQLVRQALAVR